MRCRLATQLQAPSECLPQNTNRFGILECEDDDRYYSRVERESQRKFKIVHLQNPGEILLQKQLARLDSKRRS